MEVISKSEKDTLNIGKAMAKYLQKGDIVCLFGQLGSGKTILTKGIALGLGIKKNRIISPSFVLIRQYDTKKLPFYHLDLYRLKNHQNILFLGYEEYLYDEGITVIEWADRLGYLMPQEFLKIELFMRGNNRRLLKFKAEGEHYKDLLCKIKRNFKLNADSRKSILRLRSGLTLKRSRRANADSRR